LFFQEEEEEEEEEEGDEEEEEEEEEIVDLSICVYFNLSLDYARVSKSQELSLCGRDQPHNNKELTVVVLVVRT